jgi:GNAT superfamily N-acetyltransferase
MINIERLTTCSEQDAIDMGNLMPVLSDKFNDQPVDQGLLKEIIESPNHEQIVARLGARIVGCATLSITMGVGAGRKAYLEDFVVDPTTQGQGIGGKIWDEITLWCQEREVSLFFTSSADKEDAHRFYLKRGATIRDTTVFRYSSNK